MGESKDFENINLGYSLDRREVEKIGPFVIPSHVRSPLYRVNVVGTSGSGKSTFAKELALRLNAPYIELDLLYWEPNWKEPTDDVFFRRIEDTLSRSSRWVLDGNYNRAQPVKWKSVTTVIWLDYSYPRVLFQAVRRAIIRGIRREELWVGTGNRESLFKTFFTR